MVSGGWIKGKKGERKGSVEMASLEKIRYKLFSPFDKIFGYRHVYELQHSSHAHCILDISADHSKSNCSLENLKWSCLRLLKRSFSYLGIRGDE